MINQLRKSTKSKPDIRVTSNGNDILYSIRLTNPDESNLELTKFCVTFVENKAKGMAKVCIIDNKLCFSMDSIDDNGNVIKQQFSYPVRDWVIDNFEYGIKSARFKTSEKKSEFSIIFNNLR